jgi:ADP-ribose pyrophosphatase
MNSMLGSIKVSRFPAPQRILSGLVFYFIMARFYQRPGTMKSRETLYRGRYLSLLKIDRWEFASRSNASGVVALIAVTEQDELVLVEQFRIPVNATVIELPAGLVGDLADRNEPVLLAAQRELLEETGFEAGHLEVLMSCPGSAGMSDEVITFVLASGLTRVSAGGGDSSEDITVHVIALDEVDRWLENRRTSGTPADPKIFTALYWLNRNRAGTPGPAA